MIDLVCRECGAVHDVELAPDTGECIVCGGALIQDETERELVGPQGISKNLTDTFAESMARLDAVHGTKKGDN